MLPNEPELVMGPAQSWGSWSKQGPPGPAGDGGAEMQGLSSASGMGLPESRSLDQRLPPAPVQPQQQRDVQELPQTQVLAGAHGAESESQDQGRDPSRAGPGAPSGTKQRPLPPPCTGMQIPPWPSLPHQ